MFKTLATAAVLALGLSGAASAATLVNGGFEAPGTFNGTFTTLNAGSAALTGWAINSGSVDLINTYWQPSEGRYSIDMSGNGPSSISTTVSDLNATASYELFFDVAANPDGPPPVKTLDVLIAGVTTQVTVLQNVGTRANMNWVTYAVRFTASGATEVLSFFNNNARTNNTAYGVALDNVRVAAVPLPAAGLLLLGALGGLAAWRRRKTV